MKTSPKKVLGIIGLIMALLAVVAALIQMHQNADVKRDLADARQLLREQGFKTDLADFNFKTDAAAQTREAALTVFSGMVRPATPDETINLMPLAADDAAIVIWKEDRLKSESGPVHWADLHDSLDGIHGGLDGASDAVISGPIRFNLEASRGSAMLLKHLAPLKHLSESLGSRTMLELHEGHPDTAWTNLLAVTRLVTAWEPEPVDVSHLVRFALASIAYKVTWQMLQTNRWKDEQLERLQTEWQGVDYLKNLPETFAFKRASWVDLCQRERREPLASGFSGADFFKELVRSPRSAWAGLTPYRDQVRYRNSGSYEDEKDLLVFYRDREVEFRNAILASNWLEMRQLPGITNRPFFHTKYRSRWQSMMNMRETSTSLFNHGSTFLSRAAEAEAQRRIMVTAIALERYHGRHGGYPQTLAALVPEFLKDAPVDFINGKPLNYRLTADGHYVLYSVGLDGVDNGGKLRAEEGRPAPGRMRGAFMEFPPAGVPPQADIVWPRPANATELDEVATAQLQEEAAQAREMDELEESQAEEEWNRTARHQAGVENLPTVSVYPVQPDLSYGGHPLSEVLRNPDASGNTNRPSLAEMLSLRQIITGTEPEIVTFQVPVAYDKLTNFGSLVLLLDTNNDDAESGCYAQQVECGRADNGDCLLAWNTIYESPGKHVLQMAIDLDKPISNHDFVFGPMSGFMVSNLCQFSTSSAHFEPETGATWRARLPEANGNYVLECNDTDGTRLKTISGSTSNGVIKVHWNLVDDHGQRFTGDSFDSVLHLTLPDSGRTQTMRGP